MASNSKKRRRVLGVSCILAALIIASSSFAWFTSKDEVTNRLTANADYGVSIVESFVPPQNMIPGQEVNKDVYAVNTGTIGAFVKETISGNLTYTYEKRVKEAPTAAVNDGYVELSDDRARAIDGATTNEAGGYLAYFKAADANDQNAVELGPVNSATKTDELDTANDPGQVEGDRWHPTKTGTYIFKRSYSPAVPEKTGWVQNWTADPSKTDEQNAADKAANDLLAPVPEKYTYAGYYYVADATDPTAEGKYYKIVIGEDPFRAASETVNATTGLADWVFDVAVDSGTLGAGVTVNEKGEIVGDPLIQYVKDVTLTNVTPHLTYHATGSDANPTTAYLNAWYTDGTSDASADYANKQEALQNAQTAKSEAYSDLLKAQSDAAVKEATYENVLGAYNTALSRYEQALADWTYADALSTASTNLINAAETRGNAEVAKDNARDAMDDALAALKSEATEMSTGSGTSAGSSTTQFGDLLSFGDTTDISYASIFQADGPNGTLETKINNGAAGNVGNQPLMTQAKNYMTQMSTKWGQIVTASERLNTALANFQLLNADAARDDAAQAQAYLDELYAARAEMEQLLKDYEDLYAALATVAESETTLTEIQSASTTTKAAITAWKNRLGAMKTRMEVGKDHNPAQTTDGIDSKTQDYIRKYNAYAEQVTVTIPAADEAWNTAVQTYNSKVDEAKTKYSNAIMKDQKRNDVNGNVAKNNYEGLTTDGSTALDDDSDKSGVAWYLTNNNDLLVSIYSVERHVGTDANPQVSDTDDATNGLAGLWKTIGKTQELSTADASGYVGSLTGTTEASYARKDLNANPVVSANAYTKAVNAVAAGQGTFKTVVGNGTTYATVTELKNALGTDASGLLSDVNTAETNYSEALGTLSTAQSDYAAADAAVTTAQGAATTAAQSDDSSISFTIYLDDEEAPLNWTPGIADGETADEVSFYYDYILEPGETSDKLIDAVKLDTTVRSKDYKSLVFDLNVDLDSAQVTYAADQKTITSDAVTQEGFGNTATVSAAEADGRVPVQWASASATPATPKIYRVGLTTVDAPTERAKIVSTVVEGKNFVYELNYDGKTYFGETNTDGSVFYEANDGKTDAKDTTSKIVLSVK